MKIVISGASGSVGQSLMPLLLLAGHSLLLISRSPDTLAHQFPECQVASYETWEAKAQGFDVFLHLAVLNNDASASPEEFFLVNRTLAAELAAAARLAGIPRFIYPSTVHALLPYSRSAYALSKIEGERSVRNAFGPHAEIPYLGLVWGGSYSGRLATLNRVPRFLARGLFAFFSALKPTTSVSLLKDYIEDQTSTESSMPEILTDDKSQNWTYRLWQRSLDIFFVLGVALLLPLLLFLWLVVVTANGRPGFFLQERIGRGGVPFRCAKFRTMQNGTRSVGTHLVDEKSVTPVGKFLRLLKIDELPQAVNVALGQMTLIGPRPSLPTQQEVIAARDLYGVVDYTPGLTGWAQVNGIDMSNPDKIAQYDAQYLGLQSVWLDVLIMKRTLFRS